MPQRTRGTVRLATARQRSQLGSKLSGLFPDDLSRGEAQRFIEAPRGCLFEADFVALIRKHRLDRPELRELHLGDIVEFRVDCDRHTPEYVARLCRLTSEYQGDRLTGHHYFKVLLQASLHNLTDEGLAQWAKDEFGGLGVLPGQVAAAFQQQFPLVARLGPTVFSGGFWRRADGFDRYSVCFGWDGFVSYLCHSWCGPTVQRAAGRVFPVVLEHRQLEAA